MAVIVLGKRDKDFGWVKETRIWLGIDGCDSVREERQGFWLGIDGCDSVREERQGFWLYRCVKRDKDFGWV